MTNPSQAFNPHLVGDKLLTFATRKFGVRNHSGQHVVNAELTDAVAQVLNNDAHLQEFLAQFPSEVHATVRERLSFA